MAALGTSMQGLPLDDVAARVAAAKSERLRPQGTAVWMLLWAQLRSPLVLMLLFAAGIALAMGEATDGIVILVIVAVGAILGFSQEYSARRAVERLRSMVATTVVVRRGDIDVDVPIDGVVPGDLVKVSAGSLVPGDCRIVEELDLHVDEAALTGETFPVEKNLVAVAVDAPLQGQRCALFLGTHVVSGTATAVVVKVGRGTVLGGIARSLERPGEPCDLEVGIERFGIMIAKVTATLAIAILGLNIVFQRPMVESFLYSLALAVGLVPELLPAIVSINLSRGARRMAESHVIVRRLSAIEDFGSIDVLCSDKTGTLTEGTVRLERAVAVDGSVSLEVRRAAVVNARAGSGAPNPIDAALRLEDQDVVGVVKIDEAPYDFVRKRMSVLVDDGGVVRLLCKGAVREVMNVCTTARGADGQAVSIELVRQQAEATFKSLSSQGLRCLAVATRDFYAVPTVTKDDEHELCLLGFITFADPPKAGIAETLSALDALGVSLKIITGDNRDVVTAIAAQIGIKDPVIVTGQDLRETSDAALARRVDGANIFAEVEPNQKERIIVALRRAGHVVGYIGDGINDAPALHAAHVGISVDSAVDVAKEAAHIVLLRKDLSVLIDGVKLGRATLANTLKYVHITASANFGNMVSMAVAGLFLPFLPLLPKQILFMNLLSDMPMMVLGSDRVDDEELAVVRRWDAAEIRRFMIVFGLVSSVFDVATFAVLRWLLESPPEFQTAWFIESLLTELVIIFVMRTRRPLWRSVAAPALLVLCVVTALLALAVPWLPGPFGFVPLTAPLMGTIVALTMGYLVVSEVTKLRFFAASATSVASQAATWRRR